MRLGAHSAQPVSARQATAPPVGADGELLGVGTRVQSEWSRAEGGDGMWYAGTVVAIYPGAKATVEFDDGELWTGALSELYALRGEDEEAPPRMAVPAAAAVAVPSGGEAAGRGKGGLRRFHWQSDGLFERRLVSRTAPCAVWVNSTVSMVFARSTARGKCMQRVCQRATD